MAHDRSAPPPSLDPATLVALREALGRYAREGDHGDLLRDALCTAADEARAKGIRAEQLLVALKEIWHALPEVRGAQGSVEQRKLLQQVISRCIREYYRDR